MNGEVLIIKLRLLKRSEESGKKQVLGTPHGGARRLFTDRIYKIYIDFYLFLFTMFILFILSTFS